MLRLFSKIWANDLDQVSTVSLRKTWPYYHKRKSRLETIYQCTKSNKETNSEKLLLLRAVCEVQRWLYRVYAFDIDFHQYPLFTVYRYDGSFIFGTWYAHTILARLPHDHHLV